MKNNGIIYLIPSPISENSSLKEIYPKSLEYIIESDIVFAENLRTARRFISRLKKHQNSPNPEIEKLDIRQLDRRTETKQIYDWCLELSQGKTACILSEAGCPGIADPGADLIHIAHEFDFTIKPVVGPSSILLALMASGFNGQKFKFNGYLPIKENELIREIKKIERESRSEDITQIFIETPYRNQKLMKTLINSCNPNTGISISKDLLGRFEFIKSTSIAKWKKIQIELDKTPCVFLMKA